MSEDDSYELTDTERDALHAAELGVEHVTEREQQRRWRERAESEDWRG